MSTPHEKEGATKEKIAEALGVAIAVERGSGAGVLCTRDGRAYVEWIRKFLKPGLHDG